MFSEIPEIIENFSLESVAFDNAYLALDSRLDDMVEFMDRTVHRIIVEVQDNNIWTFQASLPVNWSHTVTVHPHRYVILRAESSTLTDHHEDVKNVYLHKLNHVQDLREELRLRMGRMQTMIAQNFSRRDDTFPLHNQCIVNFEERHMRYPSILAKYNIVVRYKHSPAYYTQN